MKTRSTLKQHGICFNCLRTGHAAFKCTSSHRCKKCQRLHHTILHIERAPRAPNNGDSGQQPATSQQNTTGTSSEESAVHVSNMATTIDKQLIYMTCKILVTGPDGSSSTARALIDTGSGASFITKRLSRAIQLRGTKQRVQICGISGQSIDQADTYLVSFKISPVVCDGKTLDVTALVLDNVTRDLPTDRITLDPSWMHLQGIPLADPMFGTPGRIDVILGAELFADIMLHGRRYGPQGSPTACSAGFSTVLLNQLGTFNP